MRKSKAVVAAILAMMLIIPLSTSFLAVGTQAPETVRNIAKNRAVYQSSSANYNNTGQLVTDGIYKPSLSQNNPVITQQWTDSPSGEDVQQAFDKSTQTKFLSRHPQAWIQYQFPGGDKYVVKSYAITTANDQANRDPREWRLWGVTDDDLLEEVHKERERDAKA